jgi:hypothetical protein
MKPLLFAFIASMFLNVGLLVLLVSYMDKYQEKIQELQNFVTLTVFRGRK